MILDTIRHVATNMTSLKDYGHGRRSYANEQGSDYENKFPRLWLYPISVKDKYLKSGAIQPVYTLLFDAMDICDMNASTVEIEAIVKSTQLIYREFILQLSKQASIKNMIVEKAEEIVHLYDENLCGWAFQLSVISDEVISYPCPPIA